MSSVGFVSPHSVSPKPPCVDEPYDLRHSSLITSLTGSDSTNARHASTGPHGTLFSGSSCSFLAYLVFVMLHQVGNSNIGTILTFFYTLVARAVAAVNEARAFHLFSIIQKPEVGSYRFFFGIHYLISN